MKYRFIVLGIVTLLAVLGYVTLRDKKASEDVLNTLKELGVDAASAKPVLDAEATITLVEGSLYSLADKETFLRLSDKYPQVLLARDWVDLDYELTFTNQGRVFTITNQGCGRKQGGEQGCTLQIVTKKSDDAKFTPSEIRGQIEVRKSEPNAFEGVSSGVVYQAGGTLVKENAFSHLYVRSMQVQTTTDDLGKPQSLQVKARGPVWVITSAGVLQLWGQGEDVMPGQVRSGTIRGTNVLVTAENTQEVDSDCASTGCAHRMLFSVEVGKLPSGELTILKYQ